MAKRTRAILRFVPRPKERGPSSLTALDIALQKQRVTDYELDTTNQDDMKLTVFGDTGLPM